MTDVLHVIPVDDLIDHDTSGDGCPCGPRTEAVFRDDGSCGWLLRHQSLDGREQQEQATGHGTGRHWTWQPPTPEQPRPDGTPP